MERYPEIEFVCVNSDSATATPLEAQEALFESLARMEDVFVYRQDFTDEVSVQVMMAAIPLEPGAHERILQAAVAHGVQVDLVGETEYTRDELERLRDDVVRGTIPFFMPPPPAIPSPEPHSAPQGIGLRS